MKALTLIQPWATLIAVGEKEVETRSWGTPYRGPIAIHAGKKIDMDAFCEFEDELNDAGFWHASDLPTGAIIAVATLSDCVRMTAKWIDGISADEQGYGFFLPGRYGWVFQSVQRITPIPARGQQGLWNWEGPNAQAS